MKDFMIAIAITERAFGNAYSNPVIETGYMNASEAIEEANRVLKDKFGTRYKIEITRDHRKRRNRT